MRSIATFTLALSTLVGGCRSGDEPTASGNRTVAEQFGTGPAGVYVLRSVANQSLPAVVASHESYHAVMVADTIVLHADGWGGQSSVKLVTEELPAGERRVREDGAFMYTVDGNRLTAEFPCNDVIVLAACAAPPHLAGTVTPDALVLDLALGLRVPLRYTKVAGPSSVAAVRISPSTDLTVAAGSTLQLSAAALDAQGRELSARTASWHSIPSAHATVSGGTVRGVRTGTAYVIAFIDGRADTVRVSVR